MEKKIEKALNDQITGEYRSSYLYLAMAAYFESKNLAGFSHWMKMQSKEEMVHVMKFYAFINDRGSQVVFGAIEKPRADFSSEKDVFEKSLAHEREVTELINKLYSMAQSTHDNALLAFLQWFITEQVEEEKNASTILAKLDLIKNNSMGILMLDRELAERSPVDASSTKAL